MGEREDSTTTEAQDAATEAAVLVHLLAIHPTQLTAAELAREVAGAEADFAARDAIERAARDLAGVGLLHRNGDLLTPSRAALRCAELLDR
jgi:hypothetical protein